MSDTTYALKNPCPFCTFETQMECGDVVCRPVFERYDHRPAKTDPPTEGA